MGKTKGTKNEAPKASNANIRIVTNSVCDCNAPRFIDHEDILRCTKCRKPHLLLEN